MADPCPELKAVLARGYFPKELPPCFNTVAFADYAEANCAQLLRDYGDEWTKPGRYNLVRPGGGRRVLSLPNPFPYLKLTSTLLERWVDIATRCKKSVLTQSGLEVGGEEERAIRPAHQLKELFDLRLGHRASSGFMLRADVLDFYGSIYTHSIPWLMVGKAVAKAKKPKSTIIPWHDRIDRALQCVRDGQTNGVDVGPDTSFAIAELILSAIDERLAAELPSIRGFRYYDDYELYFTERSDAERALSVLQDALLDYELVLNPRKTEVIALPHPLDYGWALDLRRSSRGIVKGKGERDALVDVFEQSFRLISSGTREHVLRYALALTQEKVLGASNWEVYEKLLWQASHVEPAILPTVLGEVLRYRKRDAEALGNYSIDTGLAARVLNHHIVRSLRQSFTHEVAWAIWGIIALGEVLSDDVTKALCRTTDPVIAVMMILAQEKGAAGKEFTTDGWAEHAGAESLKSPAWLLAYEAGSRGVALGREVPGKKWPSDSLGALFYAMKKNGVQFTSDEFGYSQESFDSEEYDYSLDDEEEDDEDSDDDTYDDSDGSDDLIGDEDDPF